MSLPNEEIFTSTARQFKQDENENEYRSPFTKDINKIIFHKSFRNLQFRTQVFAFVPSKVQNRLTHSLNAACIGRSFGDLLQSQLEAEGSSDVVRVMKEKGINLGDVLFAALLVHDIGNPPFGHRGEEMIRGYFSNNSERLKKEYPELTQELYSDFLHFDGNANGFRILTKDPINSDDRNVGIKLTNTVVGTTVKYPFGLGRLEEMLEFLKDDPDTDLKRFLVSCKKKSKFGCFSSETGELNEIFSDLGLEKEITNTKGETMRILTKHPLVHLLTAADDISFLVMDLEDAWRLNIVSTFETKRFLVSILDALGATAADTETVPSLRGKAIYHLTEYCFKKYQKRYRQIMSGDYWEELLYDRIDPDDRIPEILSNLMAFSKKNIYSNKKSVLSLLSGSWIYTRILDFFLLPSEPSLVDTFIKESMSTGKDLSLQDKMDFLSQMTDNEVFDLYRSFNGIGKLTEFL